MKEKTALLIYRHSPCSQTLFQFVTFCEKMARVMKLDEIADDVGLDVNGEALLARGEQLVKLEVENHEAVSDRQKELSNGDFFFCELSSLCIVSSGKPYATSFSLHRVNKSLCIRGFPVVKRWRIVDM